MQKTQGYFTGICILVVLALSIYFEAGPSAQYANSASLPLTIYHLDPNGVMEAAPGNGFASGDPVWLRAPAGSTGLYSVTVADGNGWPVWAKQGSSVGQDGLVQLQLEPSLVPPVRSYGMTFRIVRETSPGILVVQSYYGTLLVAPGFARLVSEKFSRHQGQVNAQVRLVDEYGHAKAGVRVGIWLRPGDLFITSELTDSRGRVSFGFGEALASGQYSIEARVLDGDAVYAVPLGMSTFSVDPIPSKISLERTGWGQVRAILRDASGGGVEGRLLVLEQELGDGNWAVATAAYTNNMGQALFSAPSSTWRVSFNGDTFYSPSNSDNPSPANPATLISDSAVSSPASCTSCCPNLPASSHHVAPACGSGGVPPYTTTTLYPPSTAYAMAPTTITALLTNSRSWPARRIQRNLLLQWSHDRSPPY